VGSEGDNRKLLLELAGAAAGIVVFVSLVGGLVLSAQLHALGLPVESTVDVLPREAILAAGVRVLSTGLLAAMLVVLVLWLLNRTNVLRDEAVGAWWARIAVPVLGLGPLLAYTLAQDLTTAMLALALAATALAAAVLVVVMGRAVGFGRLGTGLFAVVAMYGGALAFARAYSPPVSLAFADVQFKDGGRTNGFLLGQTADAVVLAPDVLGRTIGRTVAIQRSEVVDLRLSKVEKQVRPIGSDPVSLFTVDHHDPRERARQQTLLRIKLSAQWKYPPLIYRLSVALWRHRFSAFLHDATPISTRDTQPATLEDLNEHTPLFAGKLVRTRGQILEATPWQEKVPQTIVFRSPDSDRYLATCELWTARKRPLVPGQTAELRGLVIASGIFVSGARTERNRIVMICSPPRVR
jgi:hypothetical protein